MRRLSAVAVVFTSFGLLLGFFLRGASPVAIAGQQQERCSATNGDVNADSTIDLSDAVTILGHLFLGGPTELVPLCGPPRASPGLPDTGQTKCFDLAKPVMDCLGGPCPGQDGSYATGCPMEGRFTDNGDGTVTDHCTELMWQRDTTDETGDGQPTEFDRADLCEALAICESLSFAGHDDWRLPNVRELQSIVDYGSFGPSIDPKFTAFWTGGAGYWSSTSDANDPSFAWIVAFGDGSVSKVINSFTSYVRAVRNAP